MSNLHVIYRGEPGEDGRIEEWVTYSYPHGIYTSGSTLEEARHDFRQAAELVHEPGSYTVHEHLERPVPPGVFIRTAIDRHTLSRDEAAGAVRQMLTVRGQREDVIRTMPLTASGDIVLVACVAEDTLGWIMEQMNDHDAIGIFLPVPGLVWSSWLAGEQADLAGATGAAVGPGMIPGGLLADVTLSEYVQQNPTAAGRLVAAGQ